MSLDMNDRKLVIHYTGHRVAGRNMAGLHPDAPVRVARAIGRTLRCAAPVAAYGSLASGADILFAEACLSLAIPLHVWLPFDVRRFRALSVAPAGTRWVTRFARARAAADSVTTLPGKSTATASFAACAAAAMHAARDAALRGGMHARQLAVWNGRASLGMAGTAADVAGWAALGLATTVVDPATCLVRSRFPDIRLLHE